jgi:hypothetical protein
VKRIDKRIQSAFQRYDTTVDLLQTFIAAKSHTQEFILLVCARLDSLSNLAFHKKSQKDNFIDFLVHHSGHKDKILSVSVPDLYDYLAYQAWVLPGALEKDGRLHVFDPRRDERYISFVWNSGIPITQKHVGLFLKALMTAIRKKYRVLPNQKLTLPSIDSAKRLADLFTAVMRKRSKRLLTETSRVGNSLSMFIKEFSLASLLYREYRCGIIHEYGVDVDPTDFYSKREIYFRTLCNDLVYPTRRLRLQFPAKFLLRILLKSLDSYRSRLLQTRRLPFDMFDEICDFMKELQFLDDKSVQQGRDIGIALTAGNGS